MRIGVFSDIHGNCVAFDAVLSDIEAQGVDSTVCLGDAVQGGPQPSQTVSRLRDLACPVVMGNADSWLLDPNPEIHEPATEEQLRVREWTLAQLSDDDRKIVGFFKPSVEVQLGSRQLLCFHGSPGSFNDKIFPNTPEDEFRKLLGGFQSSILCGGHTHMQQVRRLADSFFFNPGSVGLAYNHNQPENAFRVDPWAEYAILAANHGKTALEFRRVPFDVELLIDTILSSGKPDAEKSASLYRAAP